MSEMTDLSDAIVKKLIFEVILSNVMKRLVAQFAFLGWWWVNPIVSFILGKIAARIYEELSKSVAFMLIDVQIGAQKDAYDEATVELKKAIDKGEQDAIDKAKEEYKARLRALIKYNN